MLICWHALRRVRAGWMDVGWLQNGRRLGVDGMAANGKA
jgi:hypothetical protein